MNILARFFATRAECAQLVADLQEVIRDRDRWAALAQTLIEANHAQHESLEFIMARADALREALRAVRKWSCEDMTSLGGALRAEIDKALGEDVLNG